MSIFGTVLFDYQKIAAKRIQEQRRVLLADQPGLGKTLEVLGALELDGQFEQWSNILILTPIINAQTTWRDSIVRWVQDKYEVQLIDVSKGSAAQKSKQFANLDHNNIVLANHDALARVPEIASLVYDAVIIDESHLVLPINNPRKLTNFWRTLLNLKTSDDAIRVAVSGTPDRGKLENRYGTELFLGHTDLSKWAWAEKFFWIEDRKVSRTRTIRAITRLKDNNIWVRKDSQYIIRRTKQEVLPQLPPKRYVDVELELTKEQYAAYSLRQLEAEKELIDAQAQERNSAAAMVFSLRARQITDCLWQDADGQVEPVVGGGSAKLEWLLEWLDERGFIEHDDMADNQAQVVIVSQFSKVLHWLAIELELRGLRPQILDGGVSDTERTTIQREFQSGECRIVLLSGSMGVGINLDAADDLIMLDSPYDPDKIEQIEDRVHRASSNHHVTIWNLIAVDTIDQAIMEKVNKRYQTTRELMDGSRGVEFARKIMELA